MKNIILIFLSLLTIGGLNMAEAANIVYPKATIVKINSPVTFFIGNENPEKSLKINGEEVKIHPSGGFYHVVKLNDGKNIFTIDNGNSSELKTYTIIKPIIKTNTKSDNYIQYDSNKIVITNADNVPLRAYPTDNGESRLQHYQKGIPLKLIGEQNG